MVQHTLVHIRAAHCCWLHAYVTAGWAFTSRQDSKETKWDEIEWKHKPGIHFWNLDNRTSLSLHHVWVRWALAMEKILFSSVGVGRFLRLQLKMHQLTCTKLYHKQGWPSRIQYLCAFPRNWRCSPKPALRDASAVGGDPFDEKTPHTSMDWFVGENLQETMVFTIKYRAFRLKCSHHPILWIPILNVLGHWWAHHGIFFRGINITTGRIGMRHTSVYGGTPGMWLWKEPTLRLGTTHVANI